MIVDNGVQKPLEIEGVFSGMAGVQGSFVSFVPNRPGRSPRLAIAGMLDGSPVSLSPVKDPSGPFWTSRIEVLG